MFFFFGLLFRPFYRVIENAFVRVLGGIVQRYTVWVIDWATTEQKAIRVGDSGYTAWTHHPCIDWHG